MDGDASGVEDQTVPQDGFPDAIAPGSTLLVAGAEDPTTHHLGLRALQHYGSDDDEGIVVTTADSADETIDAYESIALDQPHPALAVLDTTSEQQSLTALYEETPVVFTPAPGDLERLVIGLSELTGRRRQGTGERHLLVRSLTPILETTTTDRVCTVLDRISGLPTGYCVLGIEYTAHDEATMAAVRDRVDVVLWVASDSDGRPTVDVQPAHRY